MMYSRETLQVKSIQFFFCLDVDRGGENVLHDSMNNGVASREQREMSQFPRKNDLNFGNDCEVWKISKTQ